MSGSPKNIRRICLEFLHVLHVESVCFMIFMSLFCWSFDGSGPGSDFWPPRYDEAILGTAPVRVRCFHGCLTHWSRSYWLSTNMSMLETTVNVNVWVS